MTTSPDVGNEPVEGDSLLRETTSWMVFLRGHSLMPIAPASCSFIFLRVRFPHKSSATNMGVRGAKPGLFLSMSKGFKGCKLSKPEGRLPLGIPCWHFCVFFCELWYPMYISVSSTVYRSGVGVVMVHVCLWVRAGEPNEL